MMMTKIHGPSIATQWLQTLSDYAYLSDDSDFSRRISQISPEEIPISSEERKNIPRDIVLFLKKVHSWEGITETVHGLFLLVL